MTRPAFDLQTLLQQAGRGDQAAWGQLYDEYGRRVYGLLMKQCGNPTLAEELTQVTFVKIVEKIRPGEGYQEQGQFEAWLFRIAMNKLRDEMRRRKRHAAVTDMSPGADHALAKASPRGQSSYGGNPADAIERDEQIDRLHQAIRALSEKDQQLLQLRHTAGLSFAQIAETLDQPLGTVLARGHRALAKLKKAMEHTDQQ